MEGKTPTEKMHSLSNTVTSHAERLQSLDASVARLEGELARSNQALAESRHTIIRLEEQLAEFQRWKAETTPLKTEVAVLRRDVDKLEKVKEEWGRRIWAIAGPVLGAVVGWILGVFSRK